MAGIQCNQIFFFFVCFGLLMWVVGGIIWVYLNITKHEIPYPSICDLFYCLLSPSIILGIFILFRNNSEDLLSDLHKISTIIILFLVNSFVLLFRYNPIELQEKENLIKFFLTLFYTISDCIAIGLLIAISLGPTWRKLGVSVKWSLIYLLVALILGYTANLFFSIVTSSALEDIFPYFDGSWIDFTFASSMFFISLSILEIRNSILTNNNSKF